MDRRGRPGTQTVGPRGAKGRSAGAVVEPGEAVVLHSVLKRVIVDADRRRRPSRHRIVAGGEFEDGDVREVVSEARQVVDAVELRGAVLLGALVDEARHLLRERPRGTQPPNRRAVEVLQLVAHDQRCELPAKTGKRAAVTDCTHRAVTVPCPTTRLRSHDTGR